MTSITRYPIAVPAALILLVSALLSACPAFMSGKPQGGGSLVVSLKSGSRSLAPSLDTTAASFDISGTGPGSASFSDTAVTGSTLTKTALVPGSWTITAVGKNAAGAAVLGATGTVVIVLGAEARLDLVLTPLAGNGGLSLNISWTTGLIASPSVAATLAPLSGTARTLVFSPGADGHSLAFSTTDVAAGYHTLEILLSDGSLARWSMVETVRIVKDATTTGSWAISQADLSVDTVKQPVFSPAPGAYPGAQTVGISCATAGAVIRYTTDGSAPTANNGTIYSATIGVASTRTIKARAFKSGWIDSRVASAEYLISDSVAAPTFAPSSGLRYDPIDVTISSATPDAIIMYTTNGDEPGESVGFTYSAPIPVSSDTTIKALAKKSGLSISDVSTATYRITGHVAAPVFSVATGTYSQAQSVTMSTTTSGATIRYTTDGSEPSASNGADFSTALAVNQTTTLKALALKTDWETSATTSATYTLKPLAPTFSPPAGSYMDSGITVTMGSATALSSISYTTDGSVPNGTTVGIMGSTTSLASSKTIKAIAIRSGWLNSDLATAAYTLGAAPIPANGSTTTDTTPLLDWPEIAGAVSYEIQLGSTQAEAENSTAIPCPGSSYQVGAALALGTEFWRVRGQKADTTFTSWSATWYFTIIEALVSMIDVAGGTFTQSRQVTLSNFAIGKYEVTFTQYDAFCTATARSLPSDSGWGRVARPVINVSWIDAVEFCNWLSARESLEVAYSGGAPNWSLDRTKNGYRLPTEAEWEYAARGGASSAGYDYSGSNDINAAAWYYSNSGDQTHPTGGKTANELGLFDMSGNVWEWNHDWYDSYPTTADTDPVGPSSGSDRALRGGCWLNAASFCTPSYRYFKAPAYTYNSIGFRVARTR